MMVITAERGVGLDFIDICVYYIIMERKWHAKATIVRWENILMEGHIRTLRGSGSTWQEAFQDFLRQVG